MQLFGVNVSMKPVTPRDLRKGNYFLAGLWIVATTLLASFFVPELIAGEIKVILAVSCHGLLAVGYTWVAIRDLRRDIAIRQRAM